MNNSRIRQVIQSFKMDQNLNSDMYKKEMTVVNNQKKMLNMISHQGNANQRRSEILLHTTIANF